MCLYIGNKKLGDFNAHNPIWGSEKTDANGKVIERALEKNNSVIINDGSGTRIDTHTGKISHLDLAITSPSLACKCAWNTEKNNLGSDHFFIDIKINLETNINEVHKNMEEESWSFKNIDWKKFKKICETDFDDSITSQNAQTFNENVMKTLENSIKKIVHKKRNRKHNPLPNQNSEEIFRHKTSKNTKRRKQKLRKQFGKQKIDLY